MLITFFRFFYQFCSLYIMQKGKERHDTVFDNFIVDKTNVVKNGFPLKCNKGTHTSVKVLNK